MLKISLEQWGEKKYNNENFSSLEEANKSGVIIKDILEDKISIAD